MTQLIKQDRMSGSDVGEEYKAATMLYHAVNCSGLCAFVYSNFPRADIFAEFMSAVTGWDYGLEELALAGERVLNIRQAFGAREGQNQARFKVPDVCSVSRHSKADPMRASPSEEHLGLKGCYDASRMGQGDGKTKKRKTYGMRARRHSGRVLGILTVLQ